MLLSGPPWLSSVERLAVNQLVIGSNPIGGANSTLLAEEHLPITVQEQTPSSYCSLCVRLIIRR